MFQAALVTIISTVVWTFCVWCLNKGKAKGNWYLLATLEGIMASVAFSDHITLLILFPGAAISAFCGITVVLYYTFEFEIKKIRLKKVRQ